MPVFNKIYTITDTSNERITEAGIKSGKNTCRKSAVVTYHITDIEIVKEPQDELEAWFGPVNHQQRMSEYKAA